MCGIVGHVSSGNKVSREKLIKAVNTISHRGPDHCGIWTNSNKSVGFAHARLSIIDLSSEASQPMISHDGKYIVTFNGEIYNYKEVKRDLERLGHKFQSNSDTEVLLNSYIAFGDKCTEKLVGMFSFAIYDMKRRLVFIARDRAGEKPLYYCEEKGSFYFSSELKALLEVSGIDRNVDLNSMSSILYQGFTDGTKSIVKNVRKLPAAHSITVDLTTMKCTTFRYWSLPSYSENVCSSIDLTEQLHAKLLDSVRIQLHADVPVGILLSGGLDSSLITALAAEISGNITTYNVSFPGHKREDESLYARKVSEYFSTNHIELTLQNTDPSLIETLVDYFDEPMIDSSMMPTFLLSREISKSCKVALGGDGGDELFGGYNHYRRLKAFENFVTWCPKNLGRFGEFLISHMPTGVRGKNYLNLLVNLILHKSPVVNPLFYRNDQLCMLADKSRKLNFVNELSKSTSAQDIVSYMTRYDFYNYLCEDILVKVDRASMANSLEIRAPFLDHRVIEFAFGSVHSNFKATRNDQKILLKNLGKKILPKDLDINRKQGFSIPLNTWLAEPKFENFFRDVLLSADCIFDRDFVKKILTEQKMGYKNGERIFALTQMALWVKKYNVSI